MTLKKINAWLHLWLGLSSGLIVFIVSITGCIYVFENEIRGLYEPWSFVERQEQSFLKPTQLINGAGEALNGKTPNSIRYGSKDESATVSTLDRKTGTSLIVYMNPYTAMVIHTERKNKKSNPDFFRFILNGHRGLWLPRAIGKQVVDAGVMIFVFLLISGIIMWWPKKWIKSIRDKSFKIKWNASFKRKNYDLHNVLGFYVMIFLLLISLTGLVYGYKWYSKSLYWVTSGGKPMKAFSRALSDSTSTLTFQQANIDKLYSKIIATDKAEAMFISIPGKAADAIGFTVYLKPGRLYKSNSYTFDQFTLKPVSDGSPFSGRYEDASIADKLRRMNYDLHVGAIFGIPSKIVAFLASLISASLPVTGFIIWYGKKFNKKKKGKKEQIAGSGNPGKPKLSRKAVIIKNIPVQEPA